ncbi:MAG: methyltransferase domain-containing protein [Cytophagales bacterium]|nr:methyltransferase domain-containing protein [Cytophagales bacterium]MDW8385145.1 methyltransferase domain-containing protein [Flammeovirgaceae bacterium]
MDDFALRNDVLFRSLREFDTINQYANVYTTVTKGIKKLLKGRQLLQPLTIADWACGCGETLRRIYEWAESQKIDVRLMGFDANPAVVEFAQKRTSYPQIEYYCQKVENISGQKFDIIVANSFLHHFNDDGIIRLFKKMRAQSNLGIVVSDWHRHPFLYYAICYYTQWFSESYITQYDGKLSILRGFVRKELERMAVEGGWEKVEVSWEWAFHWLVVASK